MSIDSLLSRYPSYVRHTMACRLNQYSAKKISLICRIDSAYWRCSSSPDHEEVLALLGDTEQDSTPLSARIRGGIIRRRAVRLADQHRNKRLDVHDFEEALWKTAWYVLQNFAPERGYTVWETLLCSWSVRIRNVFAATTKYKRRLCHDVQSLDQLLEACPRHSEDPTQNVEMLALGGHSEAIDNMLESPNLTPTERLLLRVILDAPNGTQKEWAALLSVLSGKAHQRRNIGKLIERIRRKLACDRLTHLYNY